MAQSACSCRQASEEWPTLIGLAACPSIHVKVSGWFRHGAEECGPATLELLTAYGADRLMFGTDFPWVMGDGEATNPLKPLNKGFEKMCRLGLTGCLLPPSPPSDLGEAGYAAQWKTFDAWAMVSSTLAIVLC